MNKKARTLTQRRIIQTLREAQSWARHWRKKQKRLDKRGLRVGVLVCDCSYRHSRIKEIAPYDPDDIRLENGASCSVRHCGIYPVDHGPNDSVRHRSKVELKAFVDAWWSHATEAEKEAYVNEVGS